jgi:hypothetical protein
MTISPFTFLIASTLCALCFVAIASPVVFSLVIALYPHHLEYPIPWYFYLPVAFLFSVLLFIAVFSKVEDPHNQ